MILSTNDFIAGREVVETIGLVKGNTIRTRALHKDLLADLGNLIGGEIQEYTKMMAEAREQALHRLEEDAKAVKADAVIGVRFATNSMMKGAAELLAYGTAVKLAPVDNSEAAPHDDRRTSA